jgi:hypothetical protein
LVSIGKKENGWTRKRRIKMSKKKVCVDAKINKEKSKKSFQF